MREFILFCLTRQLRFVICDDVYQQIQKWRKKYQKEFYNEGYSFRVIERVLQVAEKKIKEFLEKVKIEPSLSDGRYSEVKTFFARFINDKRMIGLMQKKNALSPLPEDSDMMIFSKALAFQNVWLVTTDGHFKELTTEIEQEFKIDLVTDENAFQKRDKLAAILSS